jgi:hypothetical protein
MKRILRSTALAMTIALTGTAGAQAQGAPVFDATAVARALQQLEQMRRDYETQIDQLTNLHQQLESMTGAKGISSILNSASDQDARFSANTLSGILDNAMTGSAIGGNSGALTSRITELKTTFGLPDVSGFLGSDLPQERAIATQAGSGMAAMATAEDTYARTDAATDRVNELIGGIDDTADLKASVDYNTRMLGEIAVLMNESLRLQAAMANAMGSNALSDARAGAGQRNFLRAADE